MPAQAKRQPAFVRVLKSVYHSTPMRILGHFLKFILKAVMTILLIITIACCIAGCVLTVYVFNTFANSQEVPDITRIMDNGTSIVLTQDENGEWVESQRLEGINRIWTDLENIPENLQNAVVAIEDERFWEHHGVDWKRTAAAMVNLVLRGDDGFGGSTITQQLIKVVSQDNDVKIERKIREIFRALEMERDYYTKEEILEAYLNILPLSDNVVGVGAAANYYFGKDIQELSLAECALIAGVTNSPAYYDPYDHPAHARERQKVILDKMHELGMITDDEFRQAYGEELHYKNSGRYVDVQDYYVDEIIDDVIADLMETYGYNYTYAEQLVFFGGLRIYSYEDVEIQSAMEEIFQDNAYFPDIDGSAEPINAALYIMDYQGRVIATVGGRGEKEVNRALSRATQARRQPGSAIKPLATYAPAIDQDIINYSTLVRDAPIQLPDGSWWPHNFGTATGDHGYTTVQHALQQSYNTVPIQILQQMGLQTSYDFLTEKLHFTSLEPEDLNYSPLGLGGFTYGVTVKEMCAGFQIFGNGGYYNQPHCYQRVTNQEGETLLEHIPSTAPVIDPSTATIMNKLLQTVVTYGTASAIADDWVGTEVFAKTGTTTDNKDSYFVAGTPYYVGAVWMGYDHNTEMTDYQRSIAKELWSRCMLQLHYGRSGSFEEWGDVQAMNYNPSNGIAGIGGSYGYYKSDKIPYAGNTLGEINYSGEPPETEPPTESTTEVPTLPPETTESEPPTESTEVPSETEPEESEATEPQEPTEPPEPTEPVPTDTPTEPPSEG